MNSKRREARGQSLVEFTLVVPVLLLMIFGIVDFGRAIYTYNTLSNAARAGTRVAVVNQIENSINPGECDQSAPITDPANPHWSIKGCTAAAALGLGVAESDVTVAYSSPPTEPSLPCSPGSLSLGCLITVSVQTTWHPITPIIGNIWSSIAMSTSSQSAVERIFP